MDEYKVATLALIMVRYSSFIMLAPLFGGKNVPSVIKVCLSFFLSLVTFFVLPDGYVVDHIMDVQFMFYVLKEFVTGAILGFTVYLVFSALYLAGQMIDFNLGFSMVNVMDPVAKIQVPLMGNFYYLLLITVMLVLNAHLYLLDGMVMSFKALPIGEMVITKNLIDTLLQFLITNFILAVKIASPVLVCIFIINVALGVLVKAVPQLNMFVVGLPIKLLVGLFILLVTSPIVVHIADFLFTITNEAFINVLEGLIK